MLGPGRPWPVPCCPPRDLAAACPPPNYALLLVASTIYSCSPEQVPVKVNQERRGPFSSKRDLETTTNPCDFLLSPEQKQKASQLRFRVGSKSPNSRQFTTNKLKPRWLQSDIFDLLCKKIQWSLMGLTIEKSRQFGLKELKSVQI